MSKFHGHLRKAGLLSNEELIRSQRIALETSQSLTSVWLSLGLLSEEKLANAVSEFTGFARLLLTGFPDLPISSPGLSTEYLRANAYCPLLEDDTHVLFACVDIPSDEDRAALSFATGKDTRFKVTTKSDFEAAFKRLYGGDDGLECEFEITDDVNEFDQDDIERLRDSASEAPVIRFVNQLLTNASERGASDIHVEPFEGEVKIRLRIDGHLLSIEPPPARVGAAIISRIKLMARLNIAERRLPQDGRIRLSVKGRDVDYRVSTAPTIHGESVVLRILDRSTVALAFGDLGFDRGQIATLSALMHRPHGIVLVTGPTGSGKTTTLYAALSELNTGEQKILTVEDPVEYHLKGVNQTQVRPQIDYGFASALRSFLRQDPDIIMVGEIRDLETARIAVQSALTGHLILSTLHTNNAASAITRLLDMGVEDYLITSTVNGIVAQRLVRRLCADCKRPTRPEESMLARLGLSASTGSSELVFHEPVGCDACRGTGYRGRLALLEILPLSEDLSQKVLERAQARELQHAAVNEGMETLFANGIRRVCEGETSIEEVLRVTQDGSP